MTSRSSSAVRKHHVGPKAEPHFNGFFYACRERCNAAAFHPEYHVPALNIGLRFEQAHGFTQSSEFLHLDLVVANDVYATEEADHCGHAVQYIRAQ